MENTNPQKSMPNGFIAGQVREPSMNPPAQSQKNQKDAALNKLNEDIGQSLRTLRMLEERYSTIRKKMQMSDQNMIEDTNKIFTQLKLIVKDINDLKVKIEDMRIKLDMFSNEIKEMASKQDFKILQRYLELWEPMQFMTEKQAIQLIRDALQEKETKENNAKIKK